MVITTYSSRFPSHYSIVRLHLLPVSSYTVDWWEYFFPSHHRGIVLTQNLETQLVDPQCYFCCGLVALPWANLPARVTVPQFPLPLSWGLLPSQGCTIPACCLLPSGTPLCSPCSPGLSGGAMHGCWRWTCSPQVKMKRCDYPACFPAPFLSDGKVALRVKINCLALPTESILTLSWIAYSSSHYTSAASSSSS